MSQGKYDVIVIGVGSMGAAACYMLAARGYNVLGLEQFDIPHESGSHTGQSRIIRKAYFEHPHYVLPAWHLTEHLWCMTMRGFRVPIGHVLGTGCPCLKVSVKSGPPQNAAKQRVRPLTFPR